MVAPKGNSLIRIDGKLYGEAWPQAEDLRTGKEPGRQAGLACSRKG